MNNAINDKVNGYCPNCNVILFENECITKAIELIAKRECDNCHQSFNGTIDITKEVDQ